MLVEHTLARDPGDASVLFVVARDHPDIYDHLRGGCGGFDRIDVILDRRHAERRLGRVSAVSDRRQAERRSWRVDQDLGTFGFAALRVARPHRDEKPVARESQTLSAVADTVAFLRAVTPFRQLDDDGLFTLAGRMRQEMIPAGGTLVREGEWGSTMFVIREGTLIVSKAVSGNVEKVLVHMKQGEFLGEMSLFSRRRRSASVRAFTNAVVLILDRDGLIDLFERRPRSALRFLTAIVEEFSNRLSNTDDMVAEVTRWGFEATGLSVELED